MEEEFNNKLTLKSENGTDVTINILDIIDSDEFDKTFIIYTLFDNHTNVFVSILNEEELTYSLDTITDKHELDFANNLINYFTEDDLEESAE